MTTPQLNRILEAKNKRSILYDLFPHPTGEKVPLIIFSHGYKGFKDWGPWGLVARTFSENGVHFLKYNFSHNGGTIENPIDFPDPEAFANNNYSLELEDIGRVLDLVSSEVFRSEISYTEIILLGHSRGGGVSIIKAAEDDRVSRVVTWGSVSDFRSRFLENTQEFEAWKQSGITYIENTRTHQQLPHYFQFYEDFIANANRFSIERSSKNLKKPILIIHGGDDSTVNLKEAEALKKWNGTHAELEIIPGADHVFGGQHPWESDRLPTYLLQAVKKTLEFVNNRK